MSEGAREEGSRTARAGSLAAVEAARPSAVQAAVAWSVLFAACSCVAGRLLFGGLLGDRRRLSPLRSYEKATLNDLAPSISDGTASLLHTSPTRFSYKMSVFMSSLSGVESSPAS